MAVVVVVVFGGFGSACAFGEGDFEGAQVGKLEVAILAPQEDGVGGGVVARRLQGAGARLPQRVDLSF